MFHVNEVKKADIIPFGDTGIEAYNIRSMLESFDMQVKLHVTGNINHFISLFEGNHLSSENVIICCHGDRRGIVIPELAPELEQNMPYHAVLTPGNLKDFLKLENHLIITTGCCTGFDKLADSFFDCGASSFIAPVDYVDASVCVLFVSLLMYYYSNKNLPILEAYNKAKIIDEETEMFKLWTSP